MTISIPLPRHFDQFVIRDFTMEDCQQLANIEFDPEVKKYVGLPTISKDEFVAHYQPDLLRGYAIALHPGSIIAGTISMNQFELHPKKRELRILLAKEYRDRGIASEAARFFISCIFGASWVEGIVGVAHPENTGSIALVTKLGFAHVGEITAEKQVYELSRTLSQEDRVAGR